MVESHSMCLCLLLHLAAHTSSRFSRAVVCASISCLLEAERFISCNFFSLGRGAENTLTDSIFWLHRRSPLPGRAAGSQPPQALRTRPAPSPESNLDSYRLIGLTTSWGHFSPAVERVESPGSLRHPARGRYMTHSKEVLFLL